MAKLNITERDRRMLIIGGVVVVVWALYLGAQGPLKKYQQSVKDLNAARTRISLLRAQYASVEMERSGQEAFAKLINARSRGFALFVFLQDLSAANLKGRTELQVQNSAASGGTFSEVQVTMKNVSIAEVVDYLHKVYSSKNLIIVPRVDYIKLAADQKGLDCRMTFASPRGA